MGDLVEPLALSQPAVSKHLKVLREAGLVESRTDAQRRIYRVRPEPLREVDDWLEPYRPAWAGHLNALERHLELMDDDEGRAVAVTDAYGTLERIGRRARVLRFRRRLGHPPETGLARR